MEQFTEILVQFCESAFHRFSGSRFPGKIRFAGNTGEVVAGETEYESAVQLVKLSVATEEGCRSDPRSGDLNLIHLHKRVFSSVWLQRMYKIWLL